MTDAPVLQRCAEFIANLTYEAIPEDVRREAQNALGDFVAVTMPGAVMPVSEDILRYVKTRPSEDPCVLFGEDATADAVSACLFNGTASHSLDFDDTAPSSMGHPTVSIAPAVFAAAAERQKDGQALITAYVAGLEVMHQISRLCMPEVSQAGWHTTLAFGAFGAAAAASSLYEASVDECAWALGISATTAGGVRANFGTKTKALHAGLSAANGIQNAKLAACGITANPAAFEASDGFMQCFSRLDAFKEDEIRLGTFWDLREKGLNFKSYPCCSGSHPAIEALTIYREEHGLKAEDIESIHCGVSLLSPRELTCHRPQNAVEGKFSMEYALSSLLIYGHVGLDSFTDEKVRNPAIQDFMGKISMAIDDELAALGFIGYAPVKMTIKMRDGSEVKLRRMRAKGRPELPLTLEEHQAKFFDCMRYAGCEAHAQSWWDILSNLKDASASDVARIGRAKARKCY
ncbi:MAG TPA: MmgE/PrpD family protein [Sutterella sp.]|nr:MmgE/PrpD family protein [Sutterella sp.]